MLVKFNTAGKHPGQKTAAFGHSVDAAGKSIEGATVTIVAGAGSNILELDCDTVYELSFTPVAIPAPAAT